MFGVVRELAGIWNLLEMAHARVLVVKFYGLGWFRGREVNQAGLCVAGSIT